MNLIDLYVTEVGRRLWMRGRKDIEAELRSTLQDMLEDRSQKAGRPADEEMTLDLLREYGPPDKVAATYEQHPYLIGPRIFPFFLMVLKIVLASMTLALLIALGIQLSTQGLSGAELSGAIAKAVLGVFSGAVNAFGWVVLTFVILERVLPASEFKLDEETKTWDPTTLRQSEGAELVKPWDPILDVVFTVAALVIFNGYSQLIAVSFLQDGVRQSFPVLTEAFFRWLPFMNILWGLQIILNVVLLARGRWQIVTRLASIVLDSAGTVLGYLILVGPPIVEIPAQALVAAGVLDAATATTVNTAIQQGVRIAIIVVMIVHGVQLVKNVARLVLRRG